MLVSGGLNGEIIEAEAISEKIMKLGVPSKDILIENKSTNTLENVIYSRDLIEKQLGFKNIKSVALVIKNYHSRRALMTARKHFPDNIRLLAVPYVSTVYPFTKHDWYKSDLGKKKVEEESQKIKAYLEKGDIVEIHTSDRKNASRRPF